MQAIDDKVILENLEPEAMTSGGVILPETSDQNTDRGKVVKAAPGRYTLNGTRIPSICEEGDIVAYPNQLAKKVEVDGKEYHVIRESELIMIISKGENKNG
jgi:chaperonin GroES